MLEPDGNDHLEPVEVNLERLMVYLEHGIVHLMYSRWISRLEDNFGLFPILAIATASPFRNSQGLGLKKRVGVLEGVRYFKGSLGHDIKQSRTCFVVFL